MRHTFGRRGVFSASNFAFSAGLLGLLGKNRLSNLSGRAISDPSMLDYQVIHQDWVVQWMRWSDEAFMSEIRLTHVSFASHSSRLLTPVSVGYFSIYNHQALDRYDLLRLPRGLTGDDYGCGPGCRDAISRTFSPTGIIRHDPTIQQSLQPCRVGGKDIGGGRG